MYSMPIHSDALPVIMQSVRMLRRYVSSGGGYLPDINMSYGEDNKTCSGVQNAVWHTTCERSFSLLDRLKSKLEAAAGACGLIKNKTDIMKMVVDRVTRPLLSNLRAVAEAWSRDLITPISERRAQPLSTASLALEHCQTSHFMPKTNKNQPYVKHV
ncbi:jg6840 [Pararge aegeria aegeria]|uniref:Jg6840 protein n=1 Tax=Pararge aegeria aegeria TaxID=348720 RepID=A0A8S4RMF3_9NEOP|nr:jg6840 [Pararge aegeria aegeria]